MTAKGPGLSTTEESLPGAEKLMRKEIKCPVQVRVNVKAGFQLGHIHSL